MVDEGNRWSASVLERKVFPDQVWKAYQSTQVVHSESSHDTIRRRDQVTKMTVLIEISANNSQKFQLGLSFWLILAFFRYFLSIFVDVKMI